MVIGLKSPFPCWLSLGLFSASKSATLPCLSCSYLFMPWHLSDQIQLETFLCAWGFDKLDWTHLENPGFSKIPLISNLNFILKVPPCPKTLHELTFCLKLPYLLSYTWNVTVVISLNKSPCILIVDNFVWGSLIKTCERETKEKWGRMLCGGGGRATVSIGKEMRIGSKDCGCWMLQFTSLLWSSFVLKISVSYNVEILLHT